MKKLLSRKLLVTLGTLVTVLLESDLTDWQRCVAGVIACAYVVAQGIVDKATAEQAARALERGLSEARRLQ